MVKMATANGPTTATDVVDVEVPGLDAHARVLLLKGCPAVLSLGRLIEEHKCSFSWDENGAILFDHLGRKHECLVRNYVPFLGQDYGFPALSQSVKELALPAPSSSVDEMLEEIMPESLHENDEDHTGMLHGALTSGFLMNITAM